MKTTNFYLISFRNRMGLSQKEMGLAFGVCRTAYRSWECTSAPGWIPLACAGFSASRVLSNLSQPFTAADLIHARSSLGLIQEELALELGVSRASISRWETGTPPVWMNLAIAALVFKLERLK